MFRQYKRPGRTNYPSVAVTGFNCRCAVLLLFVSLLVFSFTCSPEAREKHLLEAGRQAYLAGEYHVAKELLEKVLARDPASWEALELLANIELSLGRLEEARKRAEDAARYRPGAVSVRKLLERISRLEKAMKDSGASVDKKKEPAKTGNKKPENKVLPETNSVQIKKAAPVDRQSLLVEEARKAFEEGALEIAKKKLIEAVELDTRAFEPHFLLARVLEREGDEQEALRRIKIALDRKGDDSGALLFFARLLFKTEGREKAEPIVRSLLEKNPQDEGAKALLAKITGEVGAVEVVAGRPSVAVKLVVREKGGEGMTASVSLESREAISKNLEKMLERREELFLQVADIIIDYENAVEEKENGLRELEERLAAMRAETEKIAIERYEASKHDPVAREKAMEENIKAGELARERENFEETSGREKIEEDFLRSVHEILERALQIKNELDSLEIEISAMEKRLEKDGFQLDYRGVTDKQEARKMLLKLTGLIEECSEMPSK